MGGTSGLDRRVSRAAQKPRFPHASAGVHPQGDRVPCRRFASLRDRDQLPTYRKLRGISRQRLADELRIDASTLWRWESGASRPSPELRQRIAGQPHGPALTAPLAPGAAFSWSPGNQTRLSASDLDRAGQIWGRVAFGLQARSANRQGPGARYDRCWLDSQGKVSTSLGSARWMPPATSHP